jgi:ATP-dependent Clp protease protease subunit
MDSVPNDIITVAMGFAMSAGAFLLAHGSARFASPHARIMVHKVQAGAFGNLDDILNESEMLVNLNGYVLSVFAKDCKKSSAEVEKSLSGTKREVYMDPMQAKAYGMIDHVGVPVVNALGAQQQYQISVLSAETPVEVKTKEAKKKAKK